MVAAAAAAVRQPRRCATILHPTELAVYAALVGYFLFVLTLSGVRFCDRLVAARVPVPGLAPGGWGTTVDLADQQWRAFRDSLPLLTAVLGGFAVLSRAARALAPPCWMPHLYATAGIVFIAALHGSHTPHVLFLALAGHALGRAAARWPRTGLAAAWTWHCAVFLAVRAANGAPWSLLLGSRLGGWLDAAAGPLRWHIHYNLLVLRMLSFAADSAAAGRRTPGRSSGGSGSGSGGWLRPADREPLHAPPGTRQQQQQQPPWLSPAGERCGRADVAAAPYHRADVALYLAYVLYPPLYIAGPIMTFESFANQLASPPAGVTRAVIGRYAVRAVFCWALLEALSRRLWFVAVARGRLWEALAAAERAPLAPLDMVLVPWWTMILFWLKFTVIWRLFRLAALADGLDPPENMLRCICNNYSVVGFWRGWHASYNRWLVRYMYVPLGGARWRLLNAWPIFTFVALWHDLEPRLLGWAWLMAALIAPEAGGRWLASQRWFFDGPGGAGQQQRGYRYLQAAAASCNVVLLIAVNMVGFVLGLDGIRPFLAGVLGAPRFLPALLLAVFSGVQLMLALRDLEAAANAAVVVRGSGAGSSSSSNSCGGASGAGVGRPPLRGVSPGAVKAVEP